MEEKLNEVLKIGFNYLSELLPEFAFRLKNDHWVSSNRLKIDGTTGSDIGKVYAYQDNFYCLVDYRLNTVEIPTYLVGSDFHPEITNRHEAFIYISNHIENSPLPISNHKINKLSIDITKNKNNLQSKYVANLELATAAYFSKNSDFRGLSEKLFRHFGFGSKYKINVADENLLKKIPITLPIFNSEMGLISWLTYKHDAKNRYIFPQGNKPLLMFQRPNCRSNKAYFTPYPDEAIITEGVFDCLSAWITGFTCVTAIGGCSISDHQIGILKVSKIKKITIIFDTDEAGINGAERVSKVLKKHHFQVFILKLPSLEDGSKNDLDLFLRKSGADELKYLLEKRFYSPVADIKLSAINNHYFPSMGFDDYLKFRRYDARTLKTNLPFKGHEIGYKIGTISTIAGKTGHGKTTFLLNQCFEALVSGYRVLFVSFEERSEDLFDKLFIIFLGYIYKGIPVKNVDISKCRLIMEKILNKPDESPESNDCYNINQHFRGVYFVEILNRPDHIHYDAVKNLCKLFHEIFIETKLLGVHFDPERTIENLSENTDIYFEENPSFDLMLIDYSQLMEYHETSTRQIELKKICLQLRNIAIKYSFAILMGAQFSRAVNDYSDIAATAIGECSEIEKTSHLVFSLWNSSQEYLLNKKPRPEGMSAAVSVELSILKNRGGVLKKGYYSHEQDFNILKPAKKDISLPENYENFDNYS